MRLVKLAGKNKQARDKLSSICQQFQNKRRHQSDIKSANKPSDL